MSGIIGPRGRRSLRFALLGAVSGATASAIAELIPVGIILTRSLGPAEFDLSVGSLVPGFVFGVVVGAALVWEGAANPWQFAAYVVASTLSCLAAINLAINLVDRIDSLIVIGVIAGTFGSASLTGASALMFRFLRRSRPWLMLLAVGGVLGALLVDPLEFWWLLALFTLWQAGYAGTLAATLPRRPQAASP